MENHKLGGSAYLIRNTYDCLSSKYFFLPGVTFRTAAHRQRSNHKKNSSQHVNKYYDTHGKFHCQWIYPGHYVHIHRMSPRSGSQYRNRIPHKGSECELYTIPSRLLNINSVYAAWTSWAWLIGLEQWFSNLSRQAEPSQRLNNSVETLPKIISTRRSQRYKCSNKISRVNTYRQKRKNSNRKHLHEVDANIL